MNDLRHAGLAVQSHVRLILLVGCVEQFLHAQLLLPECLFREIRQLFGCSLSSPEILGRVLYFGLSAEAKLADAAGTPLPSLAISAFKFLPRLRTSPTRLGLVNAVELRPWALLYSWSEISSSCRAQATSMASFSSFWRSNSNSACSWAGLAFDAIGAVSRSMEAWS